MTKKDPKLGYGYGNTSIHTHTRKEKIYNNIC